MQDKDSLFKMRHSSEHVLAQALYQLYPGVKMAMGPAIDEGFYGDFEFPEGVVISSDDLQNIEKAMIKIINRNLPIRGEKVSAGQAKELFKDNPYKQEWINEIEARGEKVHLYWTGDEFVDICAGPHVEKTGDIKVIKLMSVAGAYWRGDSNNIMLTRIYGTAFPTKQELADYLHMLEEAKKRDHRKVGKEMDLYHFEPEFAPGSVFWHDKGYGVYRRLIGYIRQRQNENGYQEISTPAVMDRVLWETSGHWEKYGAHNYSGETEDGRMFCIKPMNCPGGVLVYKQGIKSYRDLPLKMAEFGKVHRYEASGSLMGLMRVREFTQDDAHIFCTQEQLEKECISALELILDIYKSFGFEEVKIYLSTRPEERIGSDEVWDLSEQSLENALTNNGYKFEINEGEGAFYGPKLEFVLRDALGREWQCGTVQVDMSLPERFDISYITEDGEKRRPVMVHRALFGSIERFMGVLMEHYAGRLPLWLAPVQVMVANLKDSDKINAFSSELMKVFEKEGIRALLNNDNETLNYKIRYGQSQRIPYILVIGEKEAEEGVLAIRAGEKGVQKMGVPVGDFVSAVKKEITSKAIVSPYV